MARQPAPLLLTGAGRVHWRTKKGSSLPVQLPEDGTMKSEQVLDVVMRRHVFASDRPFDQVLAGIFGGISQPDIAQLFSKLERAARISSSALWSSRRKA